MAEDVPKHRHCGSGEGDYVSSNRRVVVARGEDERLDQPLVFEGQSNRDRCSPGMPEYSGALDAYLSER
jgi:hypothetical protein